MPYAYVGQGHSSTNAVTYSPTAGNLLVVFSATSIGGGNPTFTVSDGSSDTWASAVSAAQLSGTGLYLGIAYTLSVGSGVTTVTLTYNGGSPGQVDVWAIEYSGAGASFFGVSAGNSQATPGTGTNVLTSNALNVTSGVPALILGLIDDDTRAANTMAAGTGYTARGSPAGTSTSLLIEDLRATSTGNQTATGTDATHGGTDTYGSFVLAFAEPATGPVLQTPGTVPRLYFVMP